MSSLPTRLLVALLVSVLLCLPTTTAQSDSSPFDDSEDSTTTTTTVAPTSGGSAAEASSATFTSDDSSSTSIGPSHGRGTGSSDDRSSSARSEEASVIPIPTQVSGSGSSELFPSSDESSSSTTTTEIPPSTETPITDAPPTPSPTTPELNTNQFILAVNGSTLMTWIRSTVGMSPLENNGIFSNQTLLSTDVLELTQVSETLSSVFSPFLAVHSLMLSQAGVSVTDTDLLKFVQQGSLAGSRFSDEARGYELTAEFSLTDGPPSASECQMLLVSVFNVTLGQTESAKNPSPQGSTDFSQAINNPSVGSSFLTSLGILSASQSSDSFPSCTRAAARVVPSASQWSELYGAPNDELNTEASSSEGVRVWVFLLVLLCSALLSGILGLVVSKFVFRPKDQPSLRSRVLNEPVLQALNTEEGGDMEGGATLAHLSGGERNQNPLGQGQDRSGTHDLL